MDQFRMNDTKIFIQQSLDFQFLSVCHYINTFGIIFYNRDLITFEERNQSVPVINTLFHFVNKSKNESEAKLQILKIALRGTDLYGGGDNETLDMRYVEETYQYIINKALFSDYGNINGYLAKIINQADNINYFTLKKTVLNDLRENYVTRDYCSVNNQSTNLTPLTIQKVLEDHIWTIFPQPEQDMSIIDVNYIYAMVGLKIVRLVATDVNLTFPEYILISREIDLQQFNNETYQIMIHMFSTPALFFYAFKMKEKFRNMNQFTLNDEFWFEAYKNLFLYISNSVNEIVNEGIESSLHYKLDKEMKNLKSRTSVAYEKLKLFCQFENVAQVSEIHVAVYKTFYHWITKLLLPDRCRTSKLPEMEQVYEDQFAEVEKLYKEIEINAVEKALEDGQLVEKMNPNATVLFAQVPNYPQHCHLCSPMPRKKNNDIYLLFAIKQETETDYFAFRQENNSLILLSNRGNEPEFATAVANNSFLRMEIAEFSQTLKFRGEDYKSFVERVAEMKTKQFIKGIKRYYYDETLGEKYLNFVKSLIPFYNCVDSAKSGDVAGAALSCTIDVLSLIPFAGFSAKYVTQVGSIFEREIGHRYLITNALARAGIVTNLAITTVLQDITRTAVRTIANEILTRGFLKDFAVATFRSVDPGFELFYKISNFGLKTFRKLFRNLISNFRNIPKFANTLAIIRNIFRNLKRNMNLIPDETGLVPVVLAERDFYSIVRYLYPGGLNHFGPTCITSYGRTAELRSIEGYPFEIPVMPEKSGGVTFYKQYIPETGKISNVKLQMGDNDILRRVGYILDKMFADGHDINLFRSYDVYHNTINWNKPLPQVEGTSILHQALLRPNSLANPNTFHNPNSPPRSYSLTASNSLVNPDSLATSNPLVNPNSVDTPDALVSPNSAVNPNPLGNLDSLVNEFPHEAVHFFSGRRFVQGSLGGNAGINHPQFFDPNFPVFGTGDVGNNYQMSNPGFSRSFQSVDPILPSTSNQLPAASYNPFSFPTSFHPNMASNFPSVVNSNLPGSSNLIPVTGSVIPGPEIPSRGASVLSFGPHDLSISGPRVPEATVPQKSNPAPHRNTNFYKSVIKSSIYSRYVRVLMIWKEYGLAFLKQDRAKLIFLRNSLNKLALLQLEKKVSLQNPIVLWCTEIVTNEKQIDFLQKLKGSSFFFNDITLLTNTAPASFVATSFNPLSVKIQIRYRLTFDSPYGVLDLTQFNRNFENNYIIFNDMLFTVTDTEFISDKNFIIVDLKSRGISREVWQRNREQDIKILAQEERTMETPRMRTITKAADFISENTPLCTFRATRDFLTNYILRTKPSLTNPVPTYEMFARDFKNMEYQSLYYQWRIQSHPYIQDVLLELNLDQITESSAAIQRIEDVYGLVYCQSIKDAFRNFKKVIGLAQLLRFEDYYVLYAYTNNKLLLNKHEIRRFEAAITRLSLRQCDEEWIGNSIVLYRGEMISKEIADNILSFRKDNIFLFDQMKIFTRQETLHLKFLDEPRSSKEIPLIIEIMLSNQAGVADIGRVLNDRNVFHVVTSDFKFIIDEVRWQIIYDREVLVFRMHDFESPTENRMVQMANKLHELFSTETKYYSEIDINSV